VKGACPHDCPDTCALVTTVQDGVAVKVQGNAEHRHTDGVLCTKVARYPERTYHPDRVLYPLRRTGPKGSGAYERVSWDEALDDIAARLAVLQPSRSITLVAHSTAGLAARAAVGEVDAVREAVHHVAAGGEEPQLPELTSPLEELKQEVLELAGEEDAFEFQRLHGMGEALYAQLAEDHPRIAYRTYAPVGSHRDLLAYLVRRLLENGANSSFVALAADDAVPVKTLLKRPSEIIIVGALPAASTGKILKHRLADAARDRVIGWV